MDLVTKLKNKKMLITEIPKWGNYLRYNWELNFANNLSISEKNNIYLDAYLWHIFSWEKVNCIKGDQANNEFDKIKKKSCYIFYQHHNYAMIIENANKIKVADFIDEEDVYVVDSDFNWTYVKTHGEDFGPYFK
ncbi:DUF4275 family protein [Bacillus sp. EAC]|uniref:DUF4275 family protein n=1 Tax=Bacillus sp. EAC TaxID=1978338 RepID=UPI000B432975|nr:DUF4275 family protein [Bacillus sp. EAC]